MNTTDEKFPLPGDSDWELSIAFSHPRARALFREPFFWDGIDDHAPWGSDEGADALASLGETQTANGSPPSIEFLFKYVGSRWSAKVPKHELTHQELEEFSVGHIEVIAIVLGFYLINGFVPREFKEIGLEAISRELQPDYLNLFGESEARREKLLIMKERLIEMEEATNSQP
jgi:uncharacterized protein YfeS